MVDNITDNLFLDNSLNVTFLLLEMEKQSDDLDIVKTNMNSMYLVIMGSIIIFMQAGFGFLEAGSIRAKNTTNILIKNFVDLTFGNYICYTCRMSYMYYITITIFLHLKLTEVCFIFSQVDLAFG
jgi:hypothetical protein